MEHGRRHTAFEVLRCSFPALIRGHCYGHADKRVRIPPMVARLIAVRSERRNAVSIVAIVREPKSPLRFNGDDLALRRVHAMMQNCVA
ncbi:hypothetical protein ACVISU_002713 [Bradyrhizobium sp. USDA 4452]